MLLDYWPLRRVTAHAGTAPAAWWRLVRDKIPLVALAAAAAVLTILAQKDAALRTLADTPLAARIGNALVSYASYLGQTCWPVKLAAFYPYIPWRARGSGVAAAAGLLAALTVAAVGLARRRPYLAVGWFWFVGTLLPVIGLIQVGDQARADRYTYLPHIGLFAAIAWGAAELAQTRLAAGPLAAAAVAASPSPPA